MQEQFPGAFPRLLPLGSGLAAVLSRFSTTEMRRIALRAFETPMTWWRSRHPNDATMAAVLEGRITPLAFDSVWAFEPIYDSEDCDGRPPAGHPATTCDAPDSSLTEAASWLLDADRAEDPAEAAALYAKVAMTAAFAAASRRWADDLPEQEARWQAQDVGEGYISMFEHPPAAEEMRAQWAHVLDGLTLGPDGPAALAARAAFRRNAARWG